VVSNHIAASSRKNLYNFYGNVAIFVDQALEFSLFDRNKKNPFSPMWRSGAEGVFNNQADKITCPNMILRETVNL
jgi:hypothetical protein